VSGRNEAGTVPFPPQRISRYPQVKLLLLAFCVLASGLSCPSPTSRGPAASPAPETYDLALFFTGNERGALKPCGCFGGQLGGLEKRTSILDRAPRARRLVVDTGGLVAGDREQDLIKFRILFEAYGLLGYDLVHLTSRDVELAADLNLQTDGVRPYETISTATSRRGRSDVFVKEFSVEAGKIVVNVAALDLRQGAIEQVASVFPPSEGPSTVNVLIVSDAAGRAAQDLATAASEAVDCIVYPLESDEPQVLSVPGRTPLVFSVGRFGRHICRLNVDVSAQTGVIALQFEDISITADLPEDPALVQLYRHYQQLVKESGLLRDYPRIPLPQDLTYVGSKACQKCHEYEYEKWSGKAHADAFATLERVGSDYDPECVICHVVAMEYTSGFVTVQETPHLKDVGCENCHGPGSQHAQTSGQAETAEPKMTCLDCHTPEHSGGYAGHEAEFLEKIVHWREP
jgi:hypothetical protein